jgi:hypothetical protein
MPRCPRRRCICIRIRAGSGRPSSACPARACCPEPTGERCLDGEVGVTAERSRGHFSIARARHGMRHRARGGSTCRCDRSGFAGQGWMESVGAGVVAAARACSARLADVPERPSPATIRPWSGVSRWGRDRRYCRAHDERLRDQRRADPGFDERWWRRIDADRPVLLVDQRVAVGRRELGDLLRALGIPEPAVAVFDALVLPVDPVALPDAVGLADLRTEHALGRGCAAPTTSATLRKPL